jgi:apolipoprotein N-acyltransferase
LITKKTAGLIGSVVLSAILLSVPFLFPNLFFVSWFCLIFWILSISDKSPGKSFFISFLIGVIFFTITMYWITYTITKYGSLHLLISLSLNILLASYLALFFGLFGLIFSWVRKKIGLNAALILGPSIWVIMEYVRGHFFTGFPWNLIAYSQYMFLPIIQIGELFGPYGLSWLILSVNTAIVFILINKKHSKTNKKLIYPAAIIIVFICCLIFGVLRIDKYPKDKNINIALIQGNTDQGRSWTIDDCNRNLKKHSMMIIEAAAANTDLAILSESALRCFGYSRENMFGDTMQRLSRESGLDLIFGSATSSPDGTEERRYYNSAVLLRADGSQPQIYNKVHLVPFGEYIPFRTILFFVDKFSKGVIGDFAHGDDYTGLTLSNGHRFGVGICYEILFPELMRQFTKNDAEFLANITNDTWYGDTPMPYHHFALSVFRAVENRKYVVRAANSGFSGIVAPDGRIMKRSELFTEAIIVHSIHPNKIKTIYSRFGDWFVYLNFLIVVLVVSLLTIKKRCKQSK